MAVICPTVTASDTHLYRQQMERVAPFARRIHVDFMDGIFAPVHSPTLAQAWWPEAVRADLHVMYQRPQDYIEAIIKMHPHLVIVHAEADGNFVVMAKQLHAAGIKAGVALLPLTPVEVIKPALEHLDHVLIFSGNLGHFGGVANLKLLEKVQACRQLKPTLEISWDGGINQHNAQQLAAGGVDVLNVGGAIHHAADPQQAFKKLSDLSIR